MRARTLLGVVLAGCLALSGCVPQAVPAKPATTATAAPPTAQSPSVASPLHDDATTLQHNPLYRVSPPAATCAAPSRPRTRAAVRSQVRALVRCAEDAWRPVLARLGMTAEPVRVRFFALDGGKTIDTPCGAQTEEYPAFYCAADHTMYVAEREVIASAGYYRLAVSATVLHEYAHHVQNVAGIIAAGHRTAEDAEVSARRIELQATCMTSMALTSLRGLGFSPQDRGDWLYQLGHGGDEVHGSTTAQTYWGTRGLDADSVGRCNTWTAPPDRVD